MSRKTQGEVFDKFVRAKNTNEINATVTGTGLGLFVAKKNYSPTETVHLVDTFLHFIRKGTSQRLRVLGLGVQL